MLMTEEMIEYCHVHSQAQGALLDELAQYTQANVHGAQMLSGSLVAATLQMLIRLSGAKRVLELGTYTGYSALAMAQALPADGKLITIEKNPQMAELAQSWFAKSEVGKRIQSLVGDINAILPTLKGPIDFAFIDADKKPTLEYVEMILTLGHPGTVIVIDNALLSGNVVHPQTDAHRAMHAANEALLADKRVQNVLLPIRDGLHVLHVCS